MNDNLEEIADEISNLTEKVMELLSEYKEDALIELKLGTALRNLFDAEDNVRFLL